MLLAGAKNNAFPTIKPYRPSRRQHLMYKNYIQQHLKNKTDNLSSDDKTERNSSHTEEIKSNMTKPFSISKDMSIKSSGDELKDQLAIESGDAVKKKINAFKTLHNDFLKHDLQVTANKNDTKTLTKSIKPENITTSSAIKDAVTSYVKVLVHDQSQHPNNQLKSTPMAKLKPSNFTLLQRLYENNNITDNLDFLTYLETIKGNDDLLQKGLQAAMNVTKQDKTMFNTLNLLSKL